jgi:hypothetical protein
MEKRFKELSLTILRCGVFYGPPGGEAANENQFVSCRLIGHLAARKATEPRSAQRP